MFVQTAGGKFEKKFFIGKIASIEQTGVLLFDAENDSDLDLYAVSGGTEQSKDSENYQDQLF
jgi:hypothetical protein